MNQAVAEVEAELIELAEAESADAEAVDAVLAGEGVGLQVNLEMPGLCTVGLATVERFEACLEIEDGPGQIVTSTFKHAAAHVLDLRFDPALSDVDFAEWETTTSHVVSSFGLQSAASSLILGVTAAHPFWSVNREDFIPAGELLLGEKVIGINGQHFRLTSITPRAGPKTVYNFEVAIAQVYYVGEGGVLVHNAHLANQLEKVQDLARKARRLRKKNGDQDSKRRAICYGPLRRL